MWEGGTLQTLQCKPIRGDRAAVCGRCRVMCWGWQAHGQHLQDVCELAVAVGHVRALRKLQNDKGQRGQGAVDGAGLL